MLATLKSSESRTMTTEYTSQNQTVSSHPLNSCEKKGIGINHTDKMGSVAGAMTILDTEPLDGVHYENGVFGYITLVSFIDR